MSETKPDIVELLRTRTLLKNVAGGSPIDEPHLAGEAADEIEKLRDRIEGLGIDLRVAVGAAYRSGAREWVRVNYPAEYERLSN